MKKSGIKITAALLTLILSSFTLFFNFTVATAEETEINHNKVLETRFLNMLNHSYVYSEDFESVEKIVNNSVVALLDLSEDGEYLKEETVNSYLYDMYGFKVDDFGEFNRDFGYKKGYVYILPRGYTVYEHKAVALTLNEDGSYLFETAVKVKTHDSASENLVCKTLFIDNPASSFRFNIVTSKIIENDLSM